MQHDRLWRVIDHERPGRGLPRAFSVTTRSAPYRTGVRGRVVGGTPSGIALAPTPPCMPFPPVPPRRGTERSSIHSTDFKKQQPARRRRSRGRMRPTQFSEKRHRRSPLSPPSTGGRRGAVSSRSRMGAGWLRGTGVGRGFWANERADVHLRIRARGSRPDVEVLRQTVVGNTVPTPRYRARRTRPVAPRSSATTDQRRAPSRAGVAGGAGSRGLVEGGQQAESLGTCQRGPSPLLWESAHAGQAPRGATPSPPWRRHRRDSTNHHNDVGWGCRPEARVKGRVLRSISTARIAQPWYSAPYSRPVRS